MNKHGMKWCNGQSYLKNIYYTVNKEQTCYTGHGTYATYAYYEEENYTILKWSDYMYKEFTKADLEDGMVVEYSNGKRRLVLNNYLIGKDGYYELSHYREDIKDKECSDRDIMRVFTISTVTTLDRIFHIENLKLIWEREEIKKMTAEEMREKLEELTGEKIEVEPSVEEKFGIINARCCETSCVDCSLFNLTMSKCLFEASVLDKENVKECYKKIMEQK